VEATLYVNTTTKTIHAALTGAAEPSVPVRLQTHLNLTVYFFATGDTAAALLDGSTTFRVALKDINTPSGSVLALLSAPTDTLATGYEFEWASVDSAALRTLLGDSASAPAILEIKWTLATTKERAAIEVAIDNAWIRAADSAPDFSAFVTSITAAGYLRIVTSDGTVYHVGLNTGEPPA